MPEPAPPARFPTVRWSHYTVSFEALPLPPTSVEVRAVVVFALCDGEFVCGDIAERGWTVPSGHVESGETPEQTAIRETWEEIGAALENPRLMGRFFFTDEAGVAFIAPVYVGLVRDYGAIPAHSESRAARRFTLAELPAHYYHWDALLESVFACAARQPEAGNR